MMLIALLFAAMIVGATVGIRTDVPPPPAATAVRTERTPATVAVRIFRTPCAGSCATAFHSSVGASV